jgi:glycosyltransferase involved in cell wall biosynthesis
VILLQYIPARYFPDRHLGWLLLWLAHARFRQRKKLILTVHEYNVAWALSPKRILGRLMLDLLACLLGALSHRIVVTHGYNQRSLRRLLFWKKDRVSIIPVGSNIPYSGIRDQGSGIRGEEEGTGNNGQRTTGSGQLTLTMFGQPAGMDRQVLISLGNWVSAHQRRVRLRWVGRSRREILDVWVGQCGLAPELLDVCDGQPAEAISQLLRSSDVFLAPLVDGVSTRRTTVIAALNHGLPVVGTDGPCTDSLFRGDPSLLLSDCGDARTFMQHVESVLSDESQRRQMRQSAQDFFARFFTWDRIAEEYRKLLGA